MPRHPTLMLGGVLIVMAGLMIPWSGALPASATTVASISPSPQLVSTISQSSVVAPVAAGSFTSIPAVRVLDTRIGVGVAGGATTPVAAGGTIAIQVAGRGDVPTTGVVAVVVDVIAVSPAAGGYLTLYPDTGAARPVVSNLDFPAGQTVSNLAEVPVGADGRILAFNGSGGRTHVVADVQGFYAAGSGSTAGAFVPVTPTRLLDTRSGMGSPVGAIPAGASRMLAVDGRGGVPASGVAAAVINLTVVSPGGGGFITAFPQGARDPGTSNLNFGPSETVANLAVVTAGIGTISLVNHSSGPIQLVADVQGYFVGTSGLPSAAGTFSTEEPALRILDTRNFLAPAQPVGPGATVPVQVSGVGHVPPSGASAVVVNVTTVSPTASGYATAYGGTSRPLSSTVDFLKGKTKAGLAVVPVGDDGKIRLFNGSPGTVQFVVDVVGYYRKNPLPTALSWQSGQVLHPAHGYPQAVSCVSDSFCVMVDNRGSATTFDGTRWSAPVHIGVDRGLDAVSCVSATFCVAVGEGGVLTQFDGTGWTAPVEIDPSGYLTSVSCASSTYCMAADTLHGRFFYDGHAWTQSPNLVGGFDGFNQVACAGDSCLGLQSSSTTRFTGSTVGDSTDVASGSDLKDLSCATVAFCIAVNTSGSAFSYDGSSWGPGTVVDPGQYLYRVSCPSTTFCVAVDVVGHAMIYDGSRWSSPIADQLNEIASVSCTPTDFCLVAGVDGRVVTLAHGTWSAPAQVETDNDIASVSCPTAAFCAAVNHAGQVVMRRDATWGAPAPIGDGRSLSAVSCVSATFCMAVGSAGQALHFDGTDWSSPTALDLTGPVSSVSCASPTFCLAVGSGGDASSFDGQQWSSARRIDPGNALTAVSCPSSTLCMAVDSNGDQTTFDGRNWSAPAGIEPGDRLDSVSCVSALFCAATDDLSGVFTFNGSNWSSRSTTAGNPGPAEVSCASSTLCVTVSVFSDTRAFDGTGWRLSTTLAPDGVGITSGPVSVSCADPAFCVAIRALGAEAYVATR